ncbi:hypothetical protein BH18ACI2_BH18ACI2_01380 [soil metagenome]
MRILICALFLNALPASLMAQEKDRWRRVDTLEDASIDMNTSRVTFGEGRIGRVRFRMILLKPEPLRGRSGVKYKSRRWIVELKCLERSYRVTESNLFDAKDELLHSEELSDPSEKWETVKEGSTMAKLWTPACELIAQKRRNP